MDSPPAEHAGAYEHGALLLVPFPSNQSLCFCFGEKRDYCGIRKDRKAQAKQLTFLHMQAYSPNFT